MGVDLATLTPGFAQPVRDAQTVFRGVLDAMSRPGRLITLRGCDQVGDFGAAGAIALTLLDFETPVWLGSEPDSNFANWLRFHCGCPLAADAQGASFAFLPAPQFPDLGVFNPGSEKYPDTAATLVITVPALTGGAAVTLEGPGIEGQVTIAPQGLGPDFWGQAAANRARFQLGVDILFAAGDAVIGLPRSTRIFPANIIQEG
jgi:alpha-D-ribose 1-methylphosphonate 5-triphosphate synthase subunit PhnH